MSTESTPGAVATRSFAPEQVARLEGDAHAWDLYPLDGEIVPVSGASRKHNLIVANLVGELRAQLRGRPCELYPGGMRVKVSETGTYVYPDVVAVCGEPDMEDDRAESLLNPTVLIEVLSPTTERDDRGRKWEHYRRLPSVREYLIVAQDQRRIERYTRQQDNQWLFSEESEPGSVVEVAAIGCVLALNEVYDKVD